MIQISGDSYLDRGAKYQEIKWENILTWFLKNAMDLVLILTINAHLAYVLNKLFSQEFLKYLSTQTVNSKTWLNVHLFTLSRDERIIRLKGIISLLCL